MAAAKEILSKIKSIKNTKKITKAMEMVAASKMRRAQERMKATRPYAEHIRQVIGHVSMAHPEYHHPYLQCIVYLGDGIMRKFRVNDGADNFNDFPRTHGLFLYNKYNILQTLKMPRLQQHRRQFQISPE